tara:strand:- start:28 stop:210 length:183 start_codon:yes stop_codon:yes gene_type:complete
MNKINIGSKGVNKNILESNFVNFVNFENFIIIKSGPKPIRIIKKYLKNISKLKILKFALN